MEITQMLAAFFLVSCDGHAKHNLALTRFDCHEDVFFTPLHGGDEGWE